jgi:hypothetical protein
MSSSSEYRTARGLARLDLSRAASDLLVANSPMFLLRKLATDAAVQTLAKETPTPVLLKALAQGLQRKPRSPRSSVLPYAILVALSQKGDFSALTEARKRRAPFHRWYSYLAAMLAQDAQATSFNALDFPPARVVTSSSPGRGRTPLIPEAAR